MCRWPALHVGLEEETPRHAIALAARRGTAGTSGAPEDGDGTAICLSRVVAAHGREGNGRGQRRESTVRAKQQWAAIIMRGANVMTACLNRYTRNLEPSMGLNRWVIVEGRDSRRGQAYLGGYKEDTEQRRQCGGMPAGGLGHADGNEQTETESLFL